MHFHGKTREQSVLDRFRDGFCGFDSFLVSFAQIRWLRVDGHLEILLISFTLGFAQTIVRQLWLTPVHLSVARF
jgi:hypothetical protein